MAAWVGAAILLILVIGAVAWGWFRGHSEQANRERVVHAIGSGSLVPDAHGKVSLPPALAADCRCIDVYAKRAKNGFLVVAFVEQLFKGANFRGRVYLSAPLGSSLANGSGLVGPQGVIVGDQQVVFFGDKISSNWYEAFNDQD